MAVPCRPPAYLPNSQSPQIVSFFPDCLDLYPDALKFFSETGDLLANDILPKVDHSHSLTVYRHGNIPKEKKCHFARFKAFSVLVSHERTLMQMHRGLSANELLHNWIRHWKTVYIKIQIVYGVAFGSGQCPHLGVCFETLHWAAHKVWAEAWTTSIRRKPSEGVSQGESRFHLKGRNRNNFKQVPSYCILVLMFALSFSMPSIAVVRDCQIHNCGFTHILQLGNQSLPPGCLVKWRWCQSWRNN